MVRGLLVEADTLVGTAPPDAQGSNSPPVVGAGWVWGAGAEGATEPQGSMVLVVPEIMS